MGSHKDSLGIALNRHALKQSITASKVAALAALLHDINCCSACRVPTACALAQMPAHIPQTSSTPRHPSS
eukprot:6208252-Pleurochrysis_carterae.AAC.1